MLRHILIFLFVANLLGCGSSPKTHFYMLNAEKQADKQVELKMKSVAIGVWSINLPTLLDRSEIVTRKDQYSIELADFHQWAGGLANNMTRLIAGELSRHLQTDQVVISPWSSYRKNDYQLKIHIDRFDGELGGDVVLAGTWSLLNAKGDKELIRKAFVFKQLAGGKEYSDMVAVLSKLTIQLTEQIANVIADQKN